MKYVILPTNSSAGYADVATPTVSKTLNVSNYGKEWYSNFHSNKSVVLVY